MSSRRASNSGSSIDSEGSGAQWFAAGSLWGFERLVLIVTTAIVQIMLARYLGTSGFGVLSAALAVSALVLPLTRFGLAGLVTSNLLANPEAELKILGTAMALRLCGALVACILGVAYLMGSGVFGTGSLGLVVLLVLAQLACVAQVTEFAFQVRSSPKPLLRWRLPVTVIAAVLKCLAASRTADPGLIAWIFAAESAVLSLVHVFALRELKGVSVRPRLDAHWQHHFARRVPWLLVSGLAEAVYLRIDLVMLTALRGPEDAGVYAAASRLSEVWYALPAVVVMTLTPLLWGGGHSARRHRCLSQATLDGLFWSAVAAATLTTLVADRLVELLFGAVFAEAAGVLQLHIWAGLFVFMRTFASQWLIAEDLLRYSLLTHGCGAIVNVALNLVLIPEYGAGGAALSTVVSYAFAGWLAFFVSARTRPLARMMTRAICLPGRFRDLRGYWRWAKVATRNGGRYWD
ncbi:MAG: flippase [Gammaproteobacteria bacterium]|nr:flippase [Gammaproteobacteria bacterium]